MLSKPKIVTAVSGFIAVPLRTPPDSVHYLYLRPNTPKVPTRETPRELFLLNVPVDATDSHIRNLFAQQLGGVRLERVDFDRTGSRQGISALPAHSRKRKRVQDEGGYEDADQTGGLPDVWDRDLYASGGSAVVTLVDRASVDLAMQEAKRAVKERKDIAWGRGMGGKEPSLGLERYRTHHHLRYVDHAVLQESTDAFMSAFAVHENALANLRARQRDEPDEDGFITVTRGGRNGPAREEATRLKQEELAQREKNRVKDDFYRFQAREKKKEMAKDLVKSFEEDAKRVEAMRRRRGKLRPES